MMKRWMIGLVMLSFILGGCAQGRPEPADPAIFEKLCEAYGYQQDHGEGTYQIVTISGTQTNTTRQQRWRDGDTLYDLTEYDALTPSGGRFESILAKREAMTLSLQLEREGSRFDNAGYVLSETEYTLEDPFTISLEETLVFDKNGKATGLDERFFYEQEGDMIRVSLKDAKQFSTDMLEWLDRSVNDTDRVSVNKAETTYTFDRRNHLVSYRSISDRMTVAENGSDPSGSVEITVTKTADVLNENEMEQIETIVTDLFDERKS